jgi:alanyl-tRNA synthetase
MKAQEIRERFTQFFQKFGHEKISSSPLIPQGDDTLLFANAGMNQFKDYFTGKAKASNPRAVSIQKCVRAGGKHNDLENVGFTARHHTFLRC